MQVNTMAESQFLLAFEGKNTSVPVWFMRQAGRYLPEYQAIKAKHSLDEMFNTPEIAAEVTSLPIDILGVDAAILFADILTLPIAMGFDIHFDSKKGPVVSPLKSLSQCHDLSEIPHIEKTIEIVKGELPEGIPLIGFAGSPFTVATYLIEGGSSINFAKTTKMMQNHPDEFHQLMTKLTDNTIRYLNFQINAGIDAFQIFDTWAGILRPTDYAHFVLPYIKKIFDRIKLPSIYYVKNCHHLLPLMDQTSADFLSVCHTVVLGHHSTIEKTKKGIQGNLYNGLLYTDETKLKKEVNDVLVGGEKHSRFIFNLSHGVLPDMDVNKLKLIVEQVHAYNRS